MSDPTPTEFVQVWVSSLPNGRLEIKRFGEVIARPKGGLFYLTSDEVSADE